MKSSALQQDFWPGYLDVLVNVMLYLLLLVGSFALGMVALTLHSIEQQQQLSFLDDKNEGVGSAALQERATQVIEEMNLTESEKVIMLTRLGQIDIEAMVRRREELDREQQLEELREAQRQRVQQLAQDNRERVAAEPAPAKTTAMRHAKADQIKAQLAALDEEFQSALAVLERERRLSQQQREASPQKLNEVIFDLRVTAKTLSASSLGAGGRDIPSRLFDRDPKVIWEFESTQFLWGADKPVPSALADANVSASWKLVILADTDNSRIMRESFARVNSVREALVRQGFARELIKVEVRSLQGVPVKDERLLRTVFMLQDA
jgi:hypothetical protein